ncbi:MAG: O-antigen ligase family protein [Rhodocyclaceae bacterium]|nr:O-antigen ligase family protein [Rhodocyclaceae bacterium]
MRTLVTAARSQYDRSLTRAIFVVFFLACVGALVSLVFADSFWAVSVFLALISFSVCGIALLIIVWTGSNAMHVWIFTFALAAIDLSLRSVGGNAPYLALKGLCYGLAVVASMATLVRTPALGGEGPVKVYLFYVLVAWLSIVYSFDKWTTAYTGFALMSLALVGWSLSRLPIDRGIQIVGAIALVLGMGSLVSVALYVISPTLVVSAETAGGGRIGGLFGSPNSLGAVTSIGILSALAAMYWERVRVPFARAWAIYAVCVLSGGIALYLSGSRTSMLALVAAVLLVTAVVRPRLTALIAIFATTLAFIGFLADVTDQLLELGVSSLSRTSHGADVRNLTGRLAIWEFAYQSWLAKPWFGYGLGASRELISHGWSNFWGGTTGSAHNALLENLLNVGVVGTTVLLVCILWLVVRIVRGFRDRSDDALIVTSICIGFLGFGVLQGVAEKSFGGTSSTATGALVVALGLSRHLGVKRR